MPVVDDSWLKQYKVKGAVMTPRGAVFGNVQMVENWDDQRGAYDQYTASQPMFVNPMPLYVTYETALQYETPSAPPMPYMYYDPSGTGPAPSAPPMPADPNAMTSAPLMADPNAPQPSAPPMPEPSAPPMPQPMADPNAMAGAPMADPNAMAGAPMADPNAMAGAPMADPNAMAGAPMPGAYPPQADPNAAVLGTTTTTTTPQM